MDAIKYLKMRDSMLRFYGADDSSCSKVDCECCPFGVGEYNKCLDHTPESVDIVEAWSKEYPIPNLSCKDCWNKEMEEL